MALCYDSRKIESSRAPKEEFKEQIEIKNRIVIATRYSLWHKAQAQRWQL
jgi:hypothetical protein